MVRVRRIWRDLLFRGMVFLGLAILAVGFVWHDNSNNQKQLSKEWIDQHGNKAERDAVFATVILDLLTGFLAISTLGLWIVTFNGIKQQGADTKNALRIAKQNADAATKSADAAEKALTDIERPYLVMGNVSIEMTKLSQANVPYIIKYSCENLGRSPAVLTRVRIKTFVSVNVDDDFNGTPFTDIFGSRYIASRVSEKLGSFKSTFVTNAGFVFGSEHYSERVYVICEFDYSDMIGNRYVYGFGGKFESMGHVANVTTQGCDAYNFHRRI